ncbi:hypothetical protein BJX99DRAFT_181551 [Aspergillus californicus]
MSYSDLDSISSNIIARSVVPSLLEPDVRFRPDLIARPGPWVMYAGFFGQRSWAKNLTEELSLAADLKRVQFSHPLTQPEVDWLVEGYSRQLYNRRAVLLAGWQIGLAHVYFTERRISRRLIMANAPHDQAMSPLRRFFVGLSIVYGNGTVPFRAIAGTTVKKLGLWVVNGWVLGIVYGTLGLRMMDPRVKESVLQSNHLSAEEKSKRGAQYSKIIAWHSMLGQRPNKHVAPGDFTASGDTDEQSWEGASSSNDSPASSTDTPASPTVGTSTYGYRVPPESESTGTGFFDDDASPTAPEYRGTTGPSSSGQGSAWDRIRRGDQYQAPTQYTSPGAAGNDNTERDKAQADFDRMLEAERRIE